MSEILDEFMVTIDQAQIKQKLNHSLILTLKQPKYLNFACKVGVNIDNILMLDLIQQ